MPKHLFFVVFGLLAVQTASAQDSKPTSKPTGKQNAKSYDFRYKFTKGEKRLYKLKAIYNQGAGIVVMTGEHKLEEHCQSVDEKAKSAEVNLESKWVQRTNNTRGSKYKGSSDQLDSMRDDEKVFYKALMAKRSVSVNSKGAISRKLSTAKSIDRNLIHWVIGGVEYLPFDYLNLPGKAVKIGDSWSHVFQRSLEGPGGKAVTFVTTFTWTLKGVKKGEQSLATVALGTQTKIKFVGGPPAKPLKIKDGMGEGTIVFNLSRGHIQSVQFVHGLKFVEGTKDVPLKHSFSATYVNAKGAPKKEAKPADQSDVKPGEAYKLRYKFSKGQKRHYKLNATYNQQEGAVLLKSQRRYEESCVSVDGKTMAAKIELKSPWVERSNNTRGMSVKGSSDDLDKMGGAEKERFEKLMAKRTVSVSALGQASRGEAQSVKRIDRNLIRWTLAGIDAVPYDYLILPSKAVTVGDSWSHIQKKTLEGPGGKEPGTFITTFTWTLKGVKKHEGQTLATIALSTKTVVKFSAGSKTPLVVKDGIGQGSVIFNVALGHVQSVKYAQSLNLVEKRGGVSLKYSFGAELVNKKQ
ncbi:MAG: hypothetical protein P1V97_15500 [Planctomycetota bacterium]|nr:hypothetical protein [Planctomycetota bacterium]